jgi:hypothetical protein
MRGSAAGVIRSFASMSDATYSNIPDSDIERRVEVRVPTSGAARLAVFEGKEAPIDLPVSLIDISRSGFQIESDRAVEPFTLVELHLRTMVVPGAVGHCRPYRNRFRIGLRTPEMAG